MKIMKKYSKFRPVVFSRHPSHSPFRRSKKNLPLLPFRSLVRFGSSTISKRNRVELNSVEAIKNSANKLLMKQCFAENNVKTANWFEYNNEDQLFIGHTEEADDLERDITDLPYPIISKHIHGSRGTGNKKHDTQESLESWMQGKDLSNYIFEKYYNYVREYRLHVNSEGCFYTCRKMLKSETPQEERWFRNDKHCVWILEENESFDKPVNWGDIVSESVKALNSVGLDFGAIDLRVQSSKNKNGEKRDYPEFIIIEINSAPSMGDVTLTKYIEEIPKMLKRKSLKQQTI